MEWQVLDILMLGPHRVDVSPGASVGRSDKIIALAMSFSSGAGHLVAAGASPHHHPAAGNPKRGGRAEVTLTALTTSPLVHWGLLSLSHMCKTACVTSLLTTLQGLPLSLRINSKIIPASSGPSSPAAGVSTAKPLALALLCFVQAKVIPAPGPLHLQFLLPGTLFLRCQYGFFSPPSLSSYVTSSESAQL